MRRYEYIEVQRRTIWEGSSTRIAWEYKDRQWRHLIDALCELGNEGWRFLYIEEALKPYKSAYFEREIDA